MNLQRERAATHSPLKTSNGFASAKSNGPSQIGFPLLIVSTVWPGPADILLQLLRHRIEKRYRLPMTPHLQLVDGEFLQIGHGKHLNLHNSPRLPEVAGCREGA